MDAFARECFKLGTLRGFKHFKAELRGREEMMLAIEVPSDSRAPQLLVPMVLAEARPPASPCQHERRAVATPGAVRCWRRRPAVQNRAIVLLPHRWIRTLQLPALAGAFRAPSSRREFCEPGDARRARPAHRGRRLVATHRPRL